MFDYKFIEYNNEENIKMHEVVTIYEYANKKSLL